MLTLPTDTVRELATQMSIYHLPPNKYICDKPLGILNRMSLASSYDDALKVYLVALTNEYLAEQERDQRETRSVLTPSMDHEYIKLNKDGIIELNEGDRSIILAIFTIAKKDALGYAIEAVMGVLSEATAPKKEKLAAAAILDQLFGDKDHDGVSSLTDKLVINLVEGGKS